MVKRLKEAVGGCRAVTLLGKGGSGKGTLAEIISKILRAHGERCHVITMSTVIGMNIKKFEQNPEHDLGRMLLLEIDKQKRGQLMSDGPVVQALIEYLLELDLRPKDFIIFDGFPRTINQWKLLIQIWPNVSSFHIKASEDGVRKRAQIRFLKTLMKGRMPRPDDLPEGVEERLSKFEEKNGPMDVIQAARKHNTTFWEIDSEALSIRKQVIFILRQLGFGGNKEFTKMVSCFDDQDHEIIRAIKEIETGVPDKARVVRIGSFFIPPPGFIGMNGGGNGLDINLLREVGVIVPVAPWYFATEQKFHHLRGVTTTYF